MLIAASKNRSAEQIAALAKLGVQHFGENYVQEAASKRVEVEQILSAELHTAQLPAQGLTWHLVGTLQRNKVQTALNLFAILQAVDSLRIAETINRRVESGRCPILLEVFMGDDPTRPGFRPSELPSALERLSQLQQLDVQGLMTVAPLGLQEVQIRQVFAELRELRDRARSGAPGLNLQHLSMGMTEDYHLAIPEGSTMVRIGRALFGA